MYPVPPNISPIAGSGLTLSAYVSMHAGLPISPQTFKALLRTYLRQHISPVHYMTMIANEQNSLGFSVIYGLCTLPLYSVLCTYSQNSIDIFIH